MSVRRTTVLAVALAMCLVSVAAGVGAGWWAGRHYAVAGPAGPSGDRGPDGATGQQGAPGQFDAVEQLKVRRLSDGALPGTAFVSTSGACPRGSAELPLAKVATNPYLQWEVEGWVQQTLAKEGLMTGYSKRSISSDSTLQYAICEH